MSARIRVLKFAGIVLVGFLIVAQAFRIQKDNPPVMANLNAPAPVKEIMKRSCYGCHSNETVWPWYSNMVIFAQTLRKVKIATRREKRTSSS